MINKIKTIWNLKKKYDLSLEELRQSELRLIGLKTYNYKLIDELINSYESKTKGFKSKIKTRELQIEDLKKQVKNLKEDGYRKGYEKGKAESKIVTLYIEGIKFKRQWDVIKSMFDR